MKRSHGMSRTPTYKSWASMIERCTKSHRYPSYGDRGIAVCDRWRTFENFLSDMGKRPPGKWSIDRIDCNGNYEPGNCRWATDKQQQRNRTNNRLNERQVAEIRQRLAAGELHRTIAQIYGCSRRLISNINCGTAWA